MQAGSPAPHFTGRAWVKAVVAQMGDDLDDLAAELTRAIHVKITALDEDLRAGTLQSTRANLSIIMTMLAEDAGPDVVAPPAETLAYARSYVRRGLGFEALQRANRIAQAGLSREFIARLRSELADAHELASTAGFLSDWLFAWFDALERGLAQHYTHEREQWMRGTLAMRTAEVRAILSGQAVDLQAAGTKLRYTLDRHHLAFVVWATVPGRGDEERSALFSAMERVADEVAGLLDAIDHLAIPLGPQLACWAGFRTPPSLDALADRIGTAAASGLSVAVGQPGHGIEGFRRSHEEAVLTRRVLQIVPVPAGYCGAYDDVALDSLLTRDREEAERFVRAELGPLAATDASALRLRATLEAFLDENCSFRRAAQRLRVHDNTVGYRVRRCEGLLGYPIKQRQLELRAALRLARILL